MRDKKRIPIILDMIAELWALEPDTRFFQLVECIGLGRRRDYADGGFHHDRWMVEDSDLEAKLREMLDARRKL